MKINILFNIFLRKKINNGTFLEAGAQDGIVNSNTYTLERYFKFKGILIEHQIEDFRKLEGKRSKCELHNCVITDREEDEIEFYGYGGCAGVKDTLTVDFKKDHPDWKPYKVKTKKLSEIKL